MKMFPTCSGKAAGLGAGGALAIVATGAAILLLAQVSPALAQGQPQGSSNSGSSIIGNIFGGNAEEKRQKDVAACLTEQRRQRMLVASKAGHYAKLSKQEEMEIMNLCSALHPPPATPAKN